MLLATNSHSRTPRSNLLNIVATVPATQVKLRSQTRR